jgi:hypothetical protein
MKNYSLILITFLAIMSSCSSDKSSINTDNLQGTWVCKKASNNGEDHDLMQNAEIIFKGDKLNFPILESVGISPEQAFTLKNDEIHLLKNKDLIFKIKELKENKLIFQFSIQDNELLVEMEKKK